MSDNHVLRIEREFSASPEVVYDAWTDPEILVQWWGPEGMTTPISSLDVQEGGRWTTTMMNDEGGKRTCSGAYKVLDRPNRLLFTWAWSDEKGKRGHETDIEVSFAKSATGTLMTLVQGRFEDANNRDMHNMGWSSSFNKLGPIVDRI